MKANHIELIARGQMLNAHANNTLLEGLYNGFYTTVQQDAQLAFHVRMNAFSGADVTERMQRLVDELSAIKTVSSCKYDGRVLTIDFRPASGFSLNKTVTAVGDCLELAAREMHLLAMQTGCAACGTAQDVHCYAINGAAHTLCTACSEQVRAGFEAQRTELKAKKGNLLTGLVGALLGALLGAILWVLVARLGYIAAVAGLVMTVCALKGYELLGGKVNTLGIVLTMLIVVVMIYFAQCISYSIEIYLLVKEDIDITFFEAYRSLPYFLGEEEVRSAFTQDLVIGYLLTALGSFATIRSLTRAKSGAYEMEQIS